MGRVVIVAYRPKPGREAELEALARDHVPFLRRLGLATDREPVLLRAKDGTVVEVFEWRDGGIEAAHTDPEVGALWGRYAEVCDFLPLKDVAEIGDMFPEFTPI